MTAYRQKLIEVALPLEAIDKEAAREKSIRHGHPSTLHLWWARRPLAACRAVLFACLIDDPDQEGVPPALLARVGGLDQTARDLAYRLYATCERKGWAQEALAYNGLVVAWPEIARLAAGVGSDRPAQTELFA